MAEDYIPTTDNGKRDWAENMVEKITPTPATWGLNSGVVTAFTALTTSYVDALAATKNPATKGPLATTTKNTTRDAMVAYARQMVATIQGVVGLTPTQKESIGITVRGENPPTPINPPDEAPIFEIISVVNRLINARLRSSSSERRGKPDKAQGASICMYTGPLPLPTEITAWTTIGESSRTNFEIELPPQIAPGTTVHLVAFWKSPRLMSGPPSARVSLVIGGGVQLAA